MVQKCVHKGCGKAFSDPEEPCVYHPGPPVFHEGQKGWNCCKPRVLTFDEFLAIPPCTTGKHSTVDDTPTPPAKAAAEDAPLHAPKPISAEALAAALAPPRAPQPSAPAPISTPEPETEDDESTLPIPQGVTCRRRGCEVQATADTAVSRTGEKCVFHPGQPIFHEGTKGWTCCKRRVLEFDEFMKLEGCKEKPQHMFVGSGRKGKGADGGEKVLDNVRHDYYQTGITVQASYYLKKIKKDEAKVEFTSNNTVDVDLPTADNSRYKATIQLFGSIDVEKSSYKIMGTKLDLTLAKKDGASWAVLQADDPRTGEIIQTGRAGRA